MRYYAAYNEDGTLLCVGTVETDGEMVGEITETEYNELLAAIPVPEEPLYADPIEEALAILTGEVDA